MLQGSYDMSFHTSPDVVTRKCTDTELALRFAQAGLGGGVLRSHYTDTSARAELLNRQFYDLHFVGGIALNRSVGGLNPAAVERCGQMGGRYVWFPTLEARSYQSFRHPAVDARMYLTVFDRDGKLRPEVLQILDVAADYNMVVGTGNLSTAEGMALVPEAAKRRVTLVLNHADNPADRYTPAQQREAVAMGAMVEHSFYTSFYNRVPFEEVARQIRNVGCENVLLPSNFGQMRSLYPDEGISLYQKKLREQGFTPDELNRIFIENVERLFGWQKRTAENTGAQKIKRRNYYALESFAASGNHGRRP